MGDITDLLAEQIKGVVRVHSPIEDVITSRVVVRIKKSPNANAHIEPGTYTIGGYTFDHSDSTSRPIYSATKDGKPVFLKGAYGSNLEQLRTETSTLTKRLGSHDHICRPCDYIRNIEDSPFQGYEFMVLPHGGETVETVVSTGITTNDALTILVQAGSAITHAHSKDVIHRDIKPTNIVVDKNRKSKVIDFGIGGHMEDVFLDQFRGYGTVVYISPEQENHDDPSKLSDVYSFCATAIFVLTGNQPYATKPTCIQDGMVQYITDRRFRKFVPAQIKDMYGKFGTHIINGLSEDPGERPEVNQLYTSAMTIKRKLANKLKTAY